MKNLQKSIKDNWRFYKKIIKKNYPKQGMFKRR